MKSLRTPDDRFVDPPDHPFAPNSAEIADGHHCFQQDTAPQIVVDAIGHRVSDTR